MIRATFEHKKYLTFLNAINKKAHAESVRHMLNYLAKGSEKNIRRSVKKKFVIRTNYTINSIKQDREAKGENTNKMFSRVVSISKYLSKQEDGGKENRKTIPTLFTRNKNFRKAVRRIYRQDKIGDFGASYYATGGKGFFLGKPKGKNRSYGIWMRHNKNKRLTKIKNVSRNDILIKPTSFFEEAIKKFATKKRVQEVFSRDAQRRLRETSKNFYTSK
jgi:hypothetical protein